MNRDAPMALASTGSLSSLDTRAMNAGDPGAHGATA